ncbi:MAG: hypothetical protein V9E89_02650 [Ilumatobacteraceae bacterium]
MWGPNIFPAIEEMLTIEPPRPASSMARPKVRLIRNVPVRLTLITVFH